MKIKKVNVKNFKSYKGSLSFNFTIEAEKNIVLIGGENGSGKSSIFEAIKLCLYGYGTYGYKGIVSNYISKIKTMINEDVYREKEIESFVEVVFDLKEKSNIVEYSMKRLWTFEDGKFNEKLYVSENGRKLNNEEIIKFEDYFKSIISPNVFDLFFFDGEKILEFFDVSKPASKVKETILTLNNFDIFSDLSRELLLNTRRKDREKKTLKEDIKIFDKLENKIFKNKLMLKDANVLIDNLVFNIEKNKESIDFITDEFIKSGGLRQEERDSLVSKITRLESDRADLNQDIKDFANDFLPFFIMENKLAELKDQIEIEDQYIAYKTVEKRLTIDSLNKTFEKRFTPEELDLILNSIKEIISPISKEESFKAIHHLSKSQSNKVLNKIEEILSINTNDIIYFKKLEDIRIGLKETRAKLAGSMDEVDEEEYTKKINILNEELNDKIKSLEKAKRVRDELDTNLIKLESELRRVNEKIESIKKANNIKDISVDIRNTTEKLLERLTFNKKLEVEKYFEEIFTRIIRKEKFIDYIDIDEDFNLTLYAYKNYSNIDIISMIMNLGMVEIEKKFGGKFIEELSGNLNGRSKEEILSYLKNMDEQENISLSTKVEISNLSSGEKQIFILCLYWALIKSSSIDIPFIIDTPYARIDEVHRMGITTEFLPNISEQVIVLSTNTEIEEELYKEIKPFVAQEYTLNYNMDTRGTEIEDGYFYEVI